MKANELRIGNLLTWEDEPNRLLIVSEIGFNNQKNRWVRFENGDGSIIEDEFSQLIPISLTEEWLVKFGFEKLWYDDNGMKLPYYRLNQNDYLFDLDYEFCATRDDAGYIYLKSVHQLQNLYFALTGEELEIK